MRAVVVLALVGCVESNVVVCGDDRVCPAEYACDEIHGLCVLPAQLTVCGETDVTCTLPSGGTGSCDQGVCIEDVCGDGIVSGVEDCEPGMGMSYDCVADGDYYDTRTLECSNRCVFPESECTGTCGDGTINGPAGRETCELGVPPLGTCLDFGFEAGRIACNESACGPDLVACRDIGFVPFYASSTGNGAVFVAAPGHVFVAESPYTVVEIKGTVVKRFDLATTSFIALWGTGPTDVYATGIPSGIYHYDGTTWTEQLAPSTQGLRGLWGAGSDVYAVGTNERVFKKSGGGAWTQINGAAGIHYNAIWGTSATAFRIVGSAGTVRKYDNGSWSIENISACTAAAPELTGIWSSSPSSVWIVGSGGLICHFNGATWAAQESGVLTTLRAIWGRGPDDIYAVGDAGAVTHYDGVKWRRLDADTPANLTGISGNGADVVYVGTTGTARRYGGAALTTESLTQPPLAFASTSPQYEYVATEDFIWQHTASGWSQIASDGATALWADASGTVFGVKSQFVQRRDPNGTLTTYPGIVTDTLFGICGRSVSDVFAVGAGGTVAHFSGGTWTEVFTVDEDTYFQDIACAATVEYTVGSNDLGGVAYKHDATGWHELPLPLGTTRLLAVVAFSDTDVYAVGVGGTAVHSSDGGATWTTLSTGVQADLVELGGTGPTDLFASGIGTLVRYDGEAWSQVRVPFDSTGALSVRPTAIHLGTSVVRTLVRDPTW